MDFKTAVMTCLKLKYMDFNGRAQRSEYWFYSLFAVIVSVVTSGIDAALGTFFVNLIASLALLLPGLGVSVRRLHDLEKSGWWLLIALIPVIGALLLLYWCIQRGTVGPNRFGDDPLEQTAPPVNSFTLKK
ncbi:membrane protein [Alphaproteobacteria bacterium]|nr:membrane protein [Alphaproteobacteria bacterium]